MPDVDPDPLSQMLPPGRHGLPKEFVAENQLARLHQGALTVFADVGDRATIADVTRAARVSRRTFYDHYRKMDELRTAVISRAIADFTDQIAAALDEKKGTASFIEGLLAFVEVRPDEFKLVLYAQAKDIAAYLEMTERLTELTGLREIVVGGILWTVKNRLSRSEPLDVDSLVKAATLANGDG